MREIASDVPPQAAATFAIRISAIAAEFGCLVLMARAFGVRSYGSYALAMAIVAIAVVPAMVGFDRLLVREVAAAESVADWSLLRGLVGRSSRIALVASLAIAAALLVVATQTRLFEPALRLPLAIASVLVPLIAFVRLQQATLQGLGNVAIGLAPESLLQPVVLSVLAAFVTLGTLAPRTAGLAVSLHVCAVAVACTAAWFLLRRRLPSQLRSAPASPHARHRLAAGTTFMWLVGMSAALVNLDTVLVGSLLGAPDAGAYRAASQLAMFVGFPLAAVSIATAPAVAALHAAGRHDELRDRSQRAARVIFVCAAIVAAAVVVAGRPILGALGPGYEVGFPVTLVLVVAYLFHAAMATSTYLLFMTAHERLAAVIFTGGVAALLAGGLVLVPRFGLVGGAVAAGVSLMGVSATSAWLAWNRTGINATIFGTTRRPAMP